MSDTADWFLFVTAPDADEKFVNRLLTYLNDYEYGTDHRYAFITSKSFPKTLTVASPPVGPFTNEWAGRDVEEIERFMLGHASNFIVVDAKGKAEGNCIIFDQVYDPEKEEMTDRFRKTRLPWDQTWSMYANLDVANMNFEEFCDEEKGDLGDGWWEYNFDKKCEVKEAEEVTEKREAALKRLEEAGQV